MTGLPFVSPGLAGGLAVVTGAGRGTGAAITARLRAAGAAVLPTVPHGARGHGG
ncbi:hypothetical protein [Streptomyces daghestanicus]|nr:hypothetical protein [Streptomyces daghestanicus]